MKTFVLLLLAALAAAFAFSASAADLPSRKAAPLLPPPPMWTGFYAGLNAGYNFGTNTNVNSQNWGGYWTAAPFEEGVPLVPYAAPGDPVAFAAGPISMVSTMSNTQSGFIGGGQVGYNMQYGSNLVLGIEADIQGTATRGTSSGVGASAFNYASPQVYPPVPVPAPAPAVSLVRENSEGVSSAAIGQTSVQGGLDWLGTVRGRLGYLWTPTMLIYGSGGLAYGNAYANAFQSAVEGLIIGESYTIGQAVWMGSGRHNQILTGWTAGGGAEWMFMPNWSLKAEALYWDLGRMNVNIASYSISPDPDCINNNVGWGRTSVSYSGVQAKAGINYHFTWGAAPVVAKY